MKKSLLGAAAFAAGIAISACSMADSHDDQRDAAQRPITMALFGDWPYNQLLLDNASLLINSVNANRDVDVVVHVGDIHSGSQPCTSAGILPPISTSNPGWSQAVFNRFQQFNAPVVYTPGDNEWTDCHKSKEKSAGAPLKELASVRELFFAQPGKTLGMHPRKVVSQAQMFDAAYPTDAQFVENVMWQQGRVVFATFNMPGSNNDTAPWTGTFANPNAQTTEVYERSGANMRWLEATFEHARKEHARAVVLALQADMWDPEALASDELSGYTPFVQKLADLAVEFGRPVLLINGDSHVYEADHPLADPASSSGQIHHTQAVPNLTRLTVQGSTNAPAEWLKLTIDTRKADIFSWQNVPYCNDPLSSCQ